MKIYPGQKGWLDKFPLAKRLITEGGKRKDPLKWLGTLEKEKVTSSELLEVLKYAEESYIPERILIDGSYKPALEAKKIVVKSETFSPPVDPTWVLYKEPMFKINNENHVDICYLAESHHSRALGVQEKMSEGKNCVVLMYEGRALGYIKQDGANSFLSFENVYWEGKCILARGILYALPHEISWNINRIKFNDVKPQTWVGVNIEDLVSLGYDISFSPRRYIEKKLIAEALTFFSEYFRENPPLVLQRDTEFRNKLSPNLDYAGTLNVATRSEYLNR